MSRADITSPCFILCNSRSRTTWLARFLCAGHEASAYASRFSDLYQYKVIVDTNIVNHYEIYKKEFPESRFYIMYRDVEDCLRSAKHDDVLKELNEDGIRSTDKNLRPLINVLPNIEYSLLDDEEYLMMLYEEINGAPCPRWYVREFLLCKIETKTKEFFETIGYEIPS